MYIYNPERIAVGNGLKNLYSNYIIIKGYFFKMSNQQQDSSGASGTEQKKEDQIPDIDLLTLAEERAASAPITDFGVSLNFFRPDHEPKKMIVCI